MVVLVLLLIVFVLEVKGDGCKNPIYSSGRTNVSLAINGDTTRLFELYTPWQVRSCPPNSCTGPPSSKNGRGLVINWHGCNAHEPILDYHNEISKVVDEAADRGYYVITPLGTKSVSNNYGWNTDGILCGTVGINDFDYFEALLSFIDEQLCVDMSRIYTIGFSTGAFLSYGIACRYPDRIAGAAVDAGGLSRSYYPTCLQGEGAVLMSSFHSLTDPTVPYNGSTIWVGQDEMNYLWRKRNGCLEDSEGVVSYQSLTSQCIRWNCPLAPVEACTIKDKEHCWYGGRSGGFPSCKPRPGDVDATKRMFDLWEEHRRV